jgi:hypothetical protein
MQGPQYTFPQLLHSRGSRARLVHSEQANSLDISGVFDRDMSMPTDDLIFQIILSIKNC